MSDDDLRVIAGDPDEPSGHVLPGSSVARRRHNYEDDGLHGVGIDQGRPKLQRQRRPTGLYEMWLHHVERLMWDAGVESTSHIARPVFNKHVAELRVDFNDAEIIEGFKNFAEQVKAGRIALTGRPAWFVFYARRGSLVRRDVSGDAVTHLEPLEMVLRPDLDEEVLVYRPEY